jgi:hypothetical protein
VSRSRYLCPANLIGPWPRDAVLVFRHVPRAGHERHAFFLLHEGLACLGDDNELAGLAIPRAGLVRHAVALVLEGLAFLCSVPLLWVVVVVVVVVLSSLFSCACAGLRVYVCVCARSRACACVINCFCVRSSDVLVGFEP